MVQVGRGVSPAGVEDDISYSILLIIHPAQTFMLGPFRMVSHITITFGGIVTCHRSPQRGVRLKEETFHAVDQNWIAYHPKENC